MRTLIAKLSSAYAKTSLRKKRKLKSLETQTLDERLQEIKRKRE